MVAHGSPSTTASSRRSRRPRRGVVRSAEANEFLGNRVDASVSLHLLEGIVAKPKNSPYQFTETQRYWRKVKNRDYSQQLGRDDLFAPAEKKPVEGSWANCAIACAEVEM
jgi:hypothetical protein